MKRTPDARSSAVSRTASARSAASTNPSCAEGPTCSAMDHFHITIPYELKSSEARLERSQSLSLLIAARSGRHCDSLPARCELEIRSPALFERNIMDSIELGPPK